MNILKIRNELRSKSIYDINLRVSFYARVSSEKDEQLNSLDNQISYYKNLINKNRNWEFVNGYIDEGISGISTKNRENFHNMIMDAKEGKFDLIITKEISRFARNTLDSIKYTRELLFSGVGVFFQNDNINTLDEDAELRLTIMSSIAQDESRKLSSRIKFGHHEAIKHGVVHGNSRIFGYTKKNKALEIDEREAPMIKKVFELYSTDNYSMKQIEDILYSDGYRNHNGNKICHTTLSNMIANPKYKGFYCGNKVKIVDMFTKQQEFLPEKDWVMYKDTTGKIVPAIVDESLWERANEVLKRRSMDVKKRQGKCNHDNLFSGKIYCTHCKKLYHHKGHLIKNGEFNDYWVCSGKIKNGVSSCNSLSIFEKDLIPMITNTIEQIAPNMDDMAKRYVLLFKKINGDASLQKKKKSLQDEQGKLFKKQERLIELSIDGGLDIVDFNRMNKDVSEKLSNIRNELIEVEQKMNSKVSEESMISEIVNNIREAQSLIKLQTIDRAFVNKFIDAIYVTPVDNNVMNVEIKLITGQQFSTVYNRDCQRLSTGHIVKKISPIETMTFARTCSHVSGCTKNIQYNISVVL